MAEIKIDKGIPVYVGRRAKWGAYDEPVKSMEVGDSILLPCSSPGSSLAQAVKHRLNMLGYRFVSRRTDGGVRVWRVS